MPKIPNLSKMSPDRWLSKMQDIREELLAEFVEVLSTCEEAESAAEGLNEMFEEFALPGDDKPEVMLVVRAEDEAIVFTNEATSDEMPLRRGGEHDRWQPVDSESESEVTDEMETEEAYRTVAVEVLELVPWWSQGAFAPKVGRPGDFVE